MKNSVQVALPVLPLTRHPIFSSNVFDGIYNICLVDVFWLVDIGQARRSHDDDGILWGNLKVGVYGLFIGRQLLCTSSTFGCSLHWGCLMSERVGCMVRKELHYAQPKPQVSTNGIEPRIEMFSSNPLTMQVSQTSTEYIVARARAQHNVLW